MNILSNLAYNDFIDWLDFILANGNIENMAADLIENHDFSVSHRIEVAAKYTKSGNPEIYTFDDLDVDF
jgi:hypothetical protein